ncbi:methylenetetrahydrofolate--tRNA-(uracil(54)-C(5))-methyltransferase (FADH(2)-oxidizing) TrmFO [Acholeplasma laidlawii]|uniref:Methylenetetrahydrofolate--tRNA-(uracil-5-)-methyltransferase TrmFO n=2 Tax=Acholeplasma laidlawii TaxID=2148 RepID=TRMFO_ACHLI|nr:methylenetetrahydrofolate--tRNA-(uracil(54)-C(5))-methyltransferase (FADH(2)-oxidizing) TrmFO [Acholeplasma laidlawii]A9NHD0.1 RecName: Full=Methylenetetrahydrofolate--tRNA-(uracil-5-)-methyltransferase TrmFO; AltName: Full=Folate-dependent tRNA (uracil-5-)-methyltransferase; AltName: Full=Folate-dependent tRNA(M-5-U54)-methyltransferase [Acholeplasma laidlawii PG-8A]ABX81760.1 glucose inhibited division protein [Acholeplasma laidlawii PG-8A]NWH10747.1 methylenetetrahydrofolate--tRNA-(uracil(
MIKIIGAGLAGSEAAYYLANKGYKVKLYEMRPKKNTPAHVTKNFAELVCSNSFRSNDPLNAVGLLKVEMTHFNSLILEAANIHKVPAGSSLAVDRNLFSEYVTEKIKSHENIEVIHEEVTSLDPNEYTIIAAGPLASDLLSKQIQDHLHLESLNFFDAVAPIIDAKSINMDIAYLKSRYDKDEAAYINCPMNKQEYLEFYKALMTAESVAPKDFENNVFEGCMPVEDMGKRGIDTLRFGPLKPVGLTKPNGEKPYAVVQLRQDDVNKTMYNMVGFQTHMKWGDQKRVIQMIPGLENAEILRYGVIHKNTYLESPKHLNNAFQVRDIPKWFFAGQISGVEGYIESAASGLNVAINLHNLLTKGEIRPLPVDTMMGAMARYISNYHQYFVPMNANFGLFDQIEAHKTVRKQMYYDRSMHALKEYIEGGI